ncbi:MAG: FAD-binding protein [Candidatus Omnitrophica bacterium]|nr:FAD-binding protein [Candidatus Omnitrophota bacterium]
MYDLIIIGAGPAGITAAIYAARKKMDLLVVSLDIGGQAAWSGEIENYAGYQFITGNELAAKFEEHMKKYAVEMREGEKAVSILKDGGVVKVGTEEAYYAARTVIIASGKRSREMGVPGEKEFRNRGVTYCATCDAPLFAGKKVVVAGGGNSALEAALQLIRIADHVYLVNNTEEPGGDAVIREKVMSSDKVTVMNSSTILEISGNGLVGGVSVQTPAGRRDLAVEGVFVEVGLIPNSEFESAVEKNGSGEIKVNFRNETSVEGIYAAGDVTDIPEKQIIIAAGEGAKAALGAFSYLARNRGWA